GCCHSRVCLVAYRYLGTHFRAIRRPRQPASMQGDPAVATRRCQGKGCLGVVGEVFLGRGY
ncbi:MAG: hypothetical protein ACK2T0_05580, partial [Anaerolineales bacterium]